MPALPILLLFIGHREYANILFEHEGKVWHSEHKAMPFGAKASVHAWDRVGEHGLQIVLVGCKLGIPPLLLQDPSSPPWRESFYTWFCSGM